MIFGNKDRVQTPDEYSKHKKKIKNNITTTHDKKEEIIKPMYSDEIVDCLEIINYCLGKDNRLIAEDLIRSIIDELKSYNWYDERWAPLSDDTNKLNMVIEFDLDYLKSRLLIDNCGEYYSITTEGIKIAMLNN